MKMATLQEERQIAIHLLRAGHSVAEVAQQLGRSRRWVRKWRTRYETESWSGLTERSRAPKKHGRRISDKVRRAIIQARSELEAEAATGAELKYIGAPAVRTKLKTKKVKPLPSIATIERVLRKGGMTRRRPSQSKGTISYPHLKPTQAHQLCQVDIVPHYLSGGERVACFNAIDVVSRYPTGQAYPQRRSQDAAEFLIHVWQTIGLSRYTQVDNESCFSGGFTHPQVLGKVVRLALMLGTELIFSPIQHPQSNGYVERFHQDYNRHVWDDTYLDDRQAVQHQADHFFSLYRHSPHHSALNDKTPYQLHFQTPPSRLETSFSLSDQKLPLKEGRIHFIRRVQQDETISLLNTQWQVPNADLQKGVWATIDFQVTGATLSVYNAAPDVTTRTCLVTYRFPLSEKVSPRLQPDLIQSEMRANEAPNKVNFKRIKPHPWPRRTTAVLTRAMFTTGAKLFLTSLNHTVRLALRVINGTMH